MKTLKVSLMILFICSFAGTLCAQSIQWANGKEYARKKSKDIYEMAPGGAVSYKIADNKCWRLLNDEMESDTPICYYEKGNNRTDFYKEGTLVGYYVPSQGRYYLVSKGADETKEAVIAVLNNGKLYNESGTVSYLVDKNTSPEIMGIFLFINI